MLKNFVGGFVGLARDDVIEGTLSGAYTVLIVFDFLWYSDNHNVTY